jgi:hypothetical protein
LGILVAAIGVAALAIWAWRQLYDGNVSRLVFSGSDLVAWNARGRILWTFNFGRPLQPLSDAPMLNPAQRLQLINSQHGSRKDVLAMAPLLVEGQPNPSSDALYRFSSAGRLLWRQGFEDKVRFEGRDYGPPWEFSALVLREDEPQPSIWCAVVSQLWSPSTLVELDRNGSRLGQFVNWGHIDALNHVREDGGSYILAGGINNECNCAMLVVLREDSPSGSSPPLPGSALSCENCSAGRPFRYLLFPRSELNALSGAAYNQVELIQTNDGRMKVGVKETKSEQILGADWEMYELSESFVPQSYTVSDHYFELHREMEAEGKIHHTVKECPELNRPRTVRMWSPEDGWKDVQVPRVVE